MDKSDLKTFLNDSLELLAGTRIDRFKRAPLRLGFAKIAELTALISGKPLMLRGKTFFKEEMQLAVPDIVSMNIYKYGVYEEDLSQIVLEYLLPGMTFFDVGAHIGYFSLLASKIVGEDGKVCAFEPNPSIFRILKENLKERGNVSLRNVALFSSPGIMELSSYGGKFSAYSSIFPPRLPASDKALRGKPKRYRVDALTLDRYVEDGGPVPDFIKIDAESSEFEILRGMDRILSDIRPIVTIEVGDMDIEGIRPSREIVECMLARKYEPYEVQGKTIVPHELQHRYTYGNILFIPG